MSTTLVVLRGQDEIMRAYEPDHIPRVGDHMFLTYPKSDLAIYIVTKVIHGLARYAEMADHTHLHTIWAHVELTA
jgi:hypothetical protein